MAGVCSHRDGTRKGVGATAHAVAYLRSLESKKDPSIALFQDPYAELLGGEIGYDYIRQRQESGGLSFKTGETVCAVRTKRIDDELNLALVDNYKQICVLGAGLDTRPWRVKLSVEGVSVHYFEVDFPEMFTYKLPVMDSAEAASDFNYHAVSADLSIDNWPEKLIASGFDPSKRTFYILEGFINYLTEAEANVFMKTLTTVLTTSASDETQPARGRIVATCLTDAIPVSRTSLHRFLPNNPLTLFESHGWNGSQILMEDLVALYQRPKVEDDSVKGYYIVSVDLK